MADIYVFRHGQTEFNRNKIFTGWLDSELTAEGLKECDHIAEQLKGVKPTKAYASDQKRAQQTLSIVLRDKKDSVPVVIDSRLRERNYGDLNGKSKAEIEKDHPNEYPLWHRSYDVRPPGGENIQDVEKRVVAFIEDELLKNLKREDVVFVSAHSNSIRPIRRYFEKLTVDEMCSFEPTFGKVYKYVVY